MLPDGWRDAKLGELLTDIKGGGTPSKKNPEYWGGNIPWASVKDITTFNRMRTQDYITQDGLNDSASNIIPAGTVIIATRMAVGKPVIFDCDVAINQDLKALFPKPPLRNDFLFEWLQSAEDRIVGMASGSTVLGIRLELLRDLDLALPPLPEQKRIAEVLGSVDAAIESTKAVIDQTKVVKQGLLQTLLTRGIGHTKFKDSPLGEIPETWEVKTLGEAATLQRGIDLPVQDRKEGVVPIYGSNGIVGYHNHAPFPAGGVITGRSGTIGSVYFSGTPYHPLNTALHVVDFHGNSPKFIALLLDFLDLKQFVAATGVPTLNRNFVHPTLVAIPPVDEQNQIAHVIIGLENWNDEQSRTLTALQTLKKGLMDDLLTGKVRVGVSSKNAAANVVPFTLTAPVDAVRKHAVLAAEITAQLHHLPTFGATKREKLTDLVVRHVGLDETTDRQAARHAAGSYDPKARREIDDIFERENWFRIQRDTAVRFIKGSAFGVHKGEFEEQFGSVKQPIQKVINLLRDYDTRHCEIVDTLYVAWNDFLLEGKSPTDDEILSDVLTNWHDSKLRISKSDWRSGLAWMRERDFVPSGRGRSTKMPSLL